MTNLKKILLVFIIIIFQTNIIVSSNITNSETLNNKISPFFFSKKNIQSSQINLIKAKAFFKKEQYSKSLAETLKVLNEAEKVQDYTLVYSCNILIGRIFKKRNKRQDALKHFKIALHTLSLNSKNLLDFNSKKTNNSFLLAKNYLLLGTEYSQLNKSDSAKLYYLKTINIHSKNKDITKIKASALNNISALFTRDSIYSQAKKYAKKAINLHRETNNKVSEASALSNLASIYLLELDYQKARELYLKGLNLINKNNSDLAIRYKEDLYYNLAWTLYLLKDYKAYEFQEKSYSIKDDLRDREIKRIVKGVFEKHQVELVKNQVELEKAQQTKTSMLFGALSLLVIIASGVVVYNYKLRQKNLGLKLSENSLIQQQSIEKLKSDSQIKILNATIDGKESERKEIAEILHDNVSALLSSANMHLSATKKQFNGDTPLEIEKTQAIILEASQKVRDLSHNLISSILLKFGLEYALKDVVKKYSNSQLKFEVFAQNINRYNQEFEIKIFNIIQELANNILKHSKASFAKITIKQEKNQLTVLVNDDGVGFSTSSSSINNGIGLNQIEARIVMMNGKLSIDSEENKGTRVSIIIPVQHKKPFILSSVS
jgi:signal transduction histidine kinase